MIKDITHVYLASRSCPECGELMRNPGYNKTLGKCRCGYLGKWFEVRKEQYLFDDGRDSKGRFHHKPGRV